MKLLTLIAILCSISCVSVAATADRPILINEVTEKTFPAFMNQFSESCMPHIRRYIGSATLASKQFNEGNYSAALFTVERYVHSTSFAIMESEECSLEDAIIIGYQNEALVPVTESIVCMFRASEGDTEWSAAADEIQSETFDLRVALQHVISAVASLEDVLDSSCTYLEPEQQERLKSILVEWKKQEQRITQALEEFDE